MVPDLARAMSARDGGNGVRARASGDATQRNGCVCNVIIMRCNGCGDDRARDNCAGNVQCSCGGRMQRRYASASAAIIADYAIMASGNLIINLLLMVINVLSAVQRQQCAMQRMPLICMAIINNMQ